MAAATVLSDAELVLKARTDAGFFGKIMERYEQKLLFYILRISHFPKAKAEEILQEIFLKAWSNLNSYDEHWPFSSWLYRIAHNETISEFRKAKSRGLLEQVFCDDEALGRIPSQVNVSEEINRKLNSENVWKILRRLSAKYRAVLVLRFLEEKSYEEIGDILHVPSGTVATLLHRAKKAFEKIAVQKHIDFI